MQSRQSDRFDAITLTASPDFSLNIPIYIGVYAQTLTAYELSFIPVYQQSYDAILNTAVPIIDSVQVPTVYWQEYEQSFYSFNPWWSDYEQRTVVLAANVIYNNIFFYAALSSYPQYYTSTF